MTDSNIYIISEIIFKTEIEKFEETTMSLPHQNTKQGLASSLWNVEHVETEIDVHLFTSKNDNSNCRYENNSKGCEKYL